MMRLDRLALAATLGRAPHVMVPGPARLQATTLRRGPLVPCAAARKAQGGDDAPKAPPRAPPRPRAPKEPPAAAPYSEALLAREYELWQRQSALYDAAQAAHAAEAERWAQERAAWAEQEAALRQELADLRAQIFFLCTRLSGSGGAAAGAAQASWPEPAALGERPAVRLSGPAGEVQAAMDAVRLGTAQAAAAVPSGGGGGDATPGWAADFAAAIAAVDEGDVLAGAADAALRLPPWQAAAGPAAAPPAAAAPAAAAAAAAPAAEPVEASPSGPPPTLVVGSDDIFWMAQAHSAMADLGYYAGDEDIEDFLFGESTRAAVETLQACEGLPETGALDAETWAVLLGPELRPRGAAAAPEDAAPAAAAAAAAPGSKPYHELFSVTVTEAGVGPGGAEVSDSVRVTEEVEVEAGPGGRVVVTERVESTHVEVLAPAEWPVLNELDGGSDVHALQAALVEHGFYPGEEDMQWWQFGSATLVALKTFQACAGLPESGTCDAATWRALLGEGATPADLVGVRTGDSDDEDLGYQPGSVWLMGEGRWEDPARLG